MRLYTYLKRKTAKVLDPIEISDPDSSGRYWSGDESDDIERERKEQTESIGNGKGSDRWRYDLEPIFLTIEYTDAAGDTARRRITARWLERRGETSFVCAICHERSAVRMFRLDRVGGIIDEDGVIEDAAAFFADCLEGDVGYPVAPGSNAGKRKAASPYTVFRRQVFPGLILLCVAARFGERIQPDHLDQIMEYVEGEADNLSGEGVLVVLPDHSAFEKIERLVRRTRPTMADLDDAIAHVASWSETRQDRLMTAILRIVQDAAINLDVEGGFFRDHDTWSEVG